MNQNAASMPTCSLLMRVSSGARQSSNAGSHRRSVAAAGLAKDQRQRAAAMSHEKRVERGVRIRRSLLLSLKVTTRQNCQRGAIARHRDVGVHQRLAAGLQKEPMRATTAVPRRGTFLLCSM